MKIHNDGIGESNVLQNQFTAYLVTAVRRQKIQFLQTKSRSMKWEIPLDMQEERKELQFEQDLTPHLPLLEQLENNDLRRALVQLKDQDLLILTRKVLDERSFQEIANETGVGYKTVTSIYYRLLQKLRKELGGEEQ
ncbi:sigma-70 family RNA polymerase sigma factor [Anaerocolumna xylanovorans]|uniref:RNA polymerase sigma factor, sigma-70 family n=1 Tax=Anaerocolumna xylanovorans DSM 12503 TaxID=1121345 RepID=A0A1M7Y141_9FIRM|nr:sigma-70 family RNA polymerase sigma factor [Anaerocolumna xylanovorans]SHO45444.1 RNA polymerase sigma factor, sigma-70 family [Anaerocolumna xylanovorans DSM 12503]